MTKLFPRFKSGDFINAEDWFKLLKISYLIVDILKSKKKDYDFTNLETKLKEVPIPVAHKKILPEHHNKHVDFLKELSHVLEDIIQSSENKDKLQHKLDELKNIISKIRYVKYEDDIMSSDYNLRAEALEKAYEIVTEFFYTIYIETWSLIIPSLNIIFFEKWEKEPPTMIRILIEQFTIREIIYGTRWLLEEWHIPPEPSWRQFFTEPWTAPPEPSWKQIFLEEWSIPPEPSMTQIFLEEWSIPPEPAMSRILLESWSIPEEPAMSQIFLEEWTLQEPSYKQIFVETWSS